MVVDGESISLALDQETYNAPPGAFEITTGKNFKIPNTKYLIGIGKIGKDKYVVPTACVSSNRQSNT